MIDYIKDKRTSYQSDGNYVTFTNIDYDTYTWIDHFIIWGAYGVPETWFKLYSKLAVWLEGSKWDDSIGEKYFCKGE